MGRIQAQAQAIELPLLIMHGDSDTMTAPSGSQFLYDRVGSGDKVLKRYPGLYHEIFNEPERDSVIDDLLGWLDTRID